MTREERNNKLKYFITCMKCKVSGKCCDENCPIQYDAGNMGEIIENLEEISKILEQEPCDDAVSRQAVLDMATTIQTDDCSGNEVMKVVDVDDIKTLPSVTPARKKGKSINKEKIMFPICSKCGLTSVEKYSFCPNCGAEMENKE